MPGGELVRTYWEYDEVSKKVELKTSNVTDKAPSLMFKSVSLDKNLKLKDILLLFKKNLPFYSIFLNNWVEEFVNEGLDNEPTETFDDVEYLELYWNTNKNTDEDKQPSKAIGTSAINSITDIYSEFDVRTTAYSILANFNYVDYCLY